MLSLNSPGHHDALYRLNCVVIALAAVSGLSVCSFAQSTVAIGSIPAALSGPSSAPVAGAQGTISRRATRPSFRLTSGSAGLYGSGGVASGDYLVDVEAKGFHSRELPVTLQVGSASSLAPGVGEQSQDIGLKMLPLEPSCEWRLENFSKF
jgi:hypothetical protein